jgi:tRNA 5-methylaminomethyl-2-thiouridine biosynthesis bifunctional protein
MSFPLIPAELAFAGDGTPFSPHYGDIYHSSQGGLAQARHVFLAGNQLPARWIGCERFVILETGFGLGLNFLATLQAWRSAAGPGNRRRLHYVAVEKHPFRLDDLRQVHKHWPELAPLATELHAQWPLPLPGLHRLDLGDVILTLAFGDGAESLGPTRPRRRRDLPRRICTGSQSGSVVGGRGRPTAAPFRSRHHTGHLDHRRRDPSPSRRRRLYPRTKAGLRRQARNADRASSRHLTCPTQRSPHRIAVIGAGIAGAATAHALAKRGHEVTRYRCGSEAASGASGNLAGVFRPLPALDDGRLARVLRAGFLLGRRSYSLAHRHTTWLDRSPARCPRCQT